MYLIIQLENGENIMKNILLIEKYYGDIAQMVDKSEWLKPIRSLVQVQLSPQTKKTVSSP